MKTFTPFEYLLIDAANNFGLDKQVFESRIQWAKDNLANMEQLIDQCPIKTKPLFIKAVMAIRKAQNKVPSGHLVGLDAVCSGLQIMSVVTGCYAGAKATGLVDPNVRADAYSLLTETMNNILAAENLSVSVSRQHAKEALMTVLYGSKAKPIEIFGEDTPEINAFYKAVTMIAPGAWELLQDLLASWQPYALTHEWTLPDGYYARVKVMTDKESRIQVDELGGATFTYYYYVYEGTKKGLSNAANVVHSLDAYVLRSMHRACNYNVENVTNALSIMNQEKETRDMFGYKDQVLLSGTKADYYLDLYKQTKVVDLCIIDYLNTANVICIPTELLNKLIAKCELMLAHKPFDLVTIHDEYKCHANYANYMRQHYIDTLVSLAEGDVLSHILSQLHNSKGTYKKLSTDLSTYIKDSNYGIC